MLCGSPSIPSTESTFHLQYCQPKPRAEAIYNGTDMRTVRGKCFAIYTECVLVSAVRAVLDYTCKYKRFCRHRKRISKGLGIIILHGFRSAWLLGLGFGGLLGVGRLSSWLELWFPNLVFERYCFPLAASSAFFHTTTSSSSNSIAPAIDLFFLLLHIYVAQHFPLKTILGGQFN